MKVSTEKNDDQPDARHELMTIPIEKRMLGEFIANLLGQRRRLARRYDVVFEISWPWLLNLDDLIIQRVEHQNEGTLVDFSAKVFFENGKVSHLGTRGDFRTFRDISDVRTVGIELIWTFVVKFPTSKTPEKQEVKFVGKTQSIDVLDKKKGSSLSWLFRRSRTEDEDLSTEIYYSNISWGEDLMALISNHVSSAFRGRSRFMTNFSAISLTLLPIIALILFFVVFIKIQNWETYTALRAFQGKWEQRFSSAPITLDLINSKLDLLVLGSDPRSFPLLPMGISIISVILVVTSILLIDNTIARSFVLLNDFTTAVRDKYYRVRNFLIASLLLSFSIGTLSSIFAAQIFEYLKK